LDAEIRARVKVLAGQSNKFLYELRYPAKNPSAAREHPSSRAAGNPTSFEELSHGYAA